VSLTPYVYGIRALETPLKLPNSDYSDKIRFSLPKKNFNRRRIFRRLNWGSVPGFVPICCDTNDPFSVKCGFVKRLLRDLPIAEDGFYRDFANFVTEWCSWNLVPLTSVMDYWEWRATLDFPESRLKQYDLAFEKLRGCAPTLKQRSHIDTFGKTEQYDEFKFMRMINSRCDAFKVFSGPIFKSIEQVVYQSSYFVKHLTPTQRQERIMSMRTFNCAYYSTDFKAFESHFTPELMRSCECVLYQYMLSHSFDSTIICNTLCGPNRMRTRSGIRLTIRGRRMSGDMCTSLGNGSTNLMLFLFAMRSKGVAEYQVRALVEGDDGLFAIPMSVSLTSSDYLKFGFTIDIKRENDPCEASFCRLVFTSSGQTIRDPFRFLNSFGFTSSFLDARSHVMDQLLRAKALSALYETPHCPIVAVLAHKALQHTVGVCPRFVRDGYHIIPHDEIKIVAFDCLPETRLLFQKKFGVSVVEQLLVEQYISDDRLDLVSSVLFPHAHNLIMESRFYL